MMLEAFKAGSCSLLGSSWMQPARFDGFVFLRNLFAEVSLTKYRGDQVVG
jgi:hypothetical protein